jgi:hypothetical protein
MTNIAQAGFAERLKLNRNQTWNFYTAPFNHLLGAPASRRLACYDR